MRSNDIGSKKRAREKGEGKNNDNLKQAEKKAKVKKAAKDRSYVRGGWGLKVPYPRRGQHIPRFGRCQRCERYGCRAAYAKECLAHIKRILRETKPSKAGCIQKTRGVSVSRGQETIQASVPLEE